MAESWQLEMRRLLEIFEQESTNSLRKINRCFVASGRSFDENFRQYFLKKSTLRLDTSFDTILIEQLEEWRTQLSSIGSVSSYDNDTSMLPPIVNNLGSLNAAEKENVMELKPEDNTDIPFEIIYTGNDDIAGEYSEMQHVDDVGSNASQNTGGSRDSDSNADIDNQVTVKCEPKVEIEDETVDLPLQMFDPNNMSYVPTDDDNAQAPESMENQSLSSHGQSRSSLNKQKQHLKQTDDKRFKCNDCGYASRYKKTVQQHQLIHQDVKPFKCAHCSYATRQKINLKTHQRTHEQQKLMGIVLDPSSGLFRCTHCDQQFGQWRTLKKHLTQSHKNNQRMFNCERCMRPFKQEIKRDAHEISCQVRRYECYLCKKYVARDVSQMQRHMRTHSDARPFQCAVCNKSYRQESGLKYHSIRNHA